MAIITYYVGLSGPLPALIGPVSVLAWSNDSTKTLLGCHKKNYKKKPLGLTTKNRKAELLGLIICPCEVYVKIMGFDYEHVH